MSSRVRSLLASVFLAAAATTVHAQPATLGAAEIALACAPPAGPAKPSPIRVLGAQDTLPHTLLSPQDLVVVQGGTAAGIQLGQQYFIRRAADAIMAYATDAARYQRGAARSVPLVDTAGWLRIVALNETTSIARIEYACDAIFTGDYLEPFQAPSVPAGSDRSDLAGELDFTALSRVAAARDHRLAAAPGEFVLIDRGTDQGLAAGDHLGVYRDLGAPGVPMIALGEAVVMSAARESAVVRIIQARDAVFVGDYLVPRKEPRP